MQHHSSLLSVLTQILSQISRSTIIEKNNVIQMPSLVTAVHCCFTSYFIFNNISYPLYFTPLLLFLEYIYGMKPSQKKLPISVCTLIDSLEKTYISMFLIPALINFTTLFTTPYSCSLLNCIIIIVHVITFFHLYIVPILQKELQK